VLKNNNEKKIKLELTNVSFY